MGKTEAVTLLSRLVGHSVPVHSPGEVDPSAPTADVDTPPLALSFRIPTERPLPAHRRNHHRHTPERGRPRHPHRHADHTYCGPRCRSLRSTEPACPAPTRTTLRRPQSRRPVPKPSWPPASASTSPAAPSHPSSSANPHPAVPWAPANPLLLLIDTSTHETAETTAQPHPRRVTEKRQFIQHVKDHLRDNAYWL